MSGHQQTDRADGARDDACLEGVEPSPFLLGAALRCVCQTSPNRRTCEAERREQVREVLRGLGGVGSCVGVLLPEHLRTHLLAAVACGEGGFRDRPTCGGAPGCNDSGTSGGMFQIKLRGAISKLYERRHGERLDVYNHREAGAWYLQVLHEAHRRTLRDCPNARRMSEADAWNVTVYRVGRGPTVSPAIPARTVCAPTTGGPVECRDLEAVPRVPRCDAGSKYARWALRWWRMEGRK